jgi:glucokinase
VVVDVASGPALVRRANAQLGTAFDRAEEVLAMAETSLAAADIITSGAHALGAALGFTVDLLDPAAIVIGGGLGLAPGRYWDELVSATRSHIWSATNAGLPIVQGALGNDAPVIGAALSVALRRRTG